jgi:2-oxoglutarate dehydrogenase E2 component (dihydrolipoamide succinyltransferase)
MVEIKVPSPGESVTEGIISRWMKPSGAFVKVDEPVFELESDKAAIDVNAPVAGVLTIVVPEGSKVQVGAVVGRIDESATTPAEPPKPAKTGDGRAPAPTPTPAPTAPPAEPARAVGASPAARKIADDAGLDLTKVPGSGRGGTVLKEDVVAATTAKPERPVLSLPPSVPSTPPQTTAPIPLPEGARETRQRMSTVRQRIAERLVAAQQSAAILTTFNEADMSAVMALRAKYKESFQKKHGVGLGFMGFFVKACCEALRVFPVANAYLDGTDIIYHHFVHVGVAVSTDKGLMVPVLRDADRLSFAGIEKGIAELAARARDGKITVGDLQGGTFTITNGGVFGSLLSTPILNPPQSAILGMHAIQKRPVVVDDEIVVRPMMYLALSYDHRIIDGREAVSFLVRVKECIEDPERLLLEV